MTIAPENILIRTLPTPNPFALKFVTNVSLKDEGKATFNSPVECSELPLPRDLFAIPGVKQVHLFQNTLTVTHSGELENTELGEHVTAVVRSRYDVHDPKFGPPPPAVKAHAAEHDPNSPRGVVEEILDRTIRPGLQADGGDVEVISFDGNELRILFQGACGGCPSAMAGTLDAIQGILRQELDQPELTVIPV